MIGGAQPSCLFGWQAVRERERERVWRIAENEEMVGVALLLAAMRLDSQYEEYYWVQSAQPICRLS